VLKRRQLLDSLAQRGVETRLPRQDWLEAEDFPRRCVRVVEHQQPIAKAVGLALRIPRGQTFVRTPFRGELIQEQIMTRVHGINGNG
jgi:hypothetical protein